MRYAVFVKSGAPGAAACAIFTLNANSVVDAVRIVAGARKIPQTPETMSHVSVWPTSELPAGWDSDDPELGLRTTDLDAELYCAPGF
jgi:hypothetical protein